MKHRAFTIWEVLIIVAVLSIAAAILFPTGSRGRENARRSSCQSNLKQIGLAFAQYTKDYDDKFPPLANVSGVGSTQLTPYIGEHEVFQCPSASGSASGSTDYFYNARLARADRVKIANPNTHVSAIILAGDGEDDQDSSYHLSQLPAAWRKDEKSPAWRHLDTGNYLFVDGHAKAYRADKIFGARDAATPTFEVK